MLNKVEASRLKVRLKSSQTNETCALYSGQTPSALADYSGQTPSARGRLLHVPVEVKTNFQSIRSQLPTPI